MHALTNRKNKIVLSDYNYRRDIEIRLLMANLTSLAVDVLREILDGSLKTTVSHLSEVLEIAQSEIIPLLDQLSATKLFLRQGDLIIVDKEMRKYLESQIIKFDPDYELGMDFLQGLLSKVPVQAIPNWYALSRTSDHLFSSIVEKHLQTPLIYQRYLDELVIDFPHAVQIARELMKAPDLTLNAADVIKKYQLTHEAFEECMLHLEYNLVCCLGYRRVGDRWEEIITPFHEWREHLTFLNDCTPKPVKDQTAIERKYSEDFGFLKLLTEHVKANKEPKGNVKAKMQLLHLVEETDSGIHYTQRADHWLQQPLQEQAATLYRRMLHNPYINDLFNDKDLREVQKSLKGVARFGWITLEDFLKGFVRPIGAAEPITLKNKGKRWRYVRPSLTSVEKEFVVQALTETLMEVGIVATGTYEGQLCFCVTPFGRMTVDD